MPLWLQWREKIKMVIIGVEYQLSSDGTRFQFNERTMLETGNGKPKVKSLERTNAINSNPMISGKFVKIDVSATEELYRSRGMTFNPEFIPYKESYLNSVGANISDEMSSKAMISRIYSDPIKEDEELNRVRAQYKEVFGEDPHHLTKLETMKSKIEEELNNN